MFFASIVLVASAHLVVVSISMGISSMIVDIPKAANRPSRGTIWGTAMAKSATHREGQGRCIFSFSLPAIVYVRRSRYLMAAMLTGGGYAAQPQRDLVKSMMTRVLRGDSRANHRPQHADRDVVCQAITKQHRQGDGYLHYLSQAVKYGNYIQGVS